MKLFDRLLTYTTIQVGVFVVLVTIEQSLTTGTIDMMFTIGIAPLSIFILGAAYLSDDSPKSAGIPGILAGLELVIALQSFAAIVYSSGLDSQPSLIPTSSLILAIVVILACFKRLNYRPAKDRNKN